MTRTGHTTRNTHGVFVAVLVVALVALYVTPAFASTQVNLHSPHVGASSETFGQDPDDGGLPDPVVWHFILNGLDKDTPAGTLYVTFAGAGSKVVTARPVGQGQTQHFYVGTPTHDTLVSAYALTDSAGFNGLVLSHVAVDDPPTDDPPTDDPPTDDPPTDDPPTDDPPTDDPPTDDPPTDDPPTDDPPTDDPPTDDPPTDDPPTDDPPTDDPPTDDPPTDDPPTDDPPEDEEPFLPFTEDEPELEYLPYTGVDGGSLATLALLLAGAGAALSRRFR